MHLTYTHNYKSKNKQTRTRNYKRLKMNLCQKIKKGGRENKETSLISFLKGKATILVQPDESQTWNFEEKAITMTFLKKKLKNKQLITESWQHPKVQLFLKPSCTTDRPSCCSTRTGQSCLPAEPAASRGLAPKPPHLFLLEMAELKVKP